MKAIDIYNMKVIEKTKCLGEISWDEFLLGLIDDDSSYSNTIVW